MEDDARRCKGRFCSVLVFLLVSCHVVLEDRADCPCTLSICLSDRPASVFVAGKMVAENLRDTCLQLWVPREDVAVRAVSGLIPEPDGAVNIPYGTDSPPLFLFDTLVNCRRESVAVDICLKKAYCTLSLDFAGPSGWDVPYRVEIRGSVDGFTAAGEPREGAFHCLLAAEEPSGTEHPTCRLPRQGAQAPLWLDIALPEGVVRSFALGTLLQQAGYDWEAPELEDIPLTLDLSVTGLSFLFEQWRDEESMNIVI